MSEEPIRSGGRAEDVLRLVLPIILLGLGVLAWELIVRLKGIPPYVLPAPSLVFATLVSDWSLLSESLR
jgi:NitT/TauT family transport system permease protein